MSVSDFPCLLLIAGMYLVKYYIGTVLYLVQTLFALINKVQS